MIQRYQLRVSIVEKATNPENALPLIRSVRNVIGRIILLKCVNRQRSRQRKITPQNKTRKEIQLKRSTSWLM